MRATANKRKLSEIFIRKLKPKDRPFAVWDTYQRGLLIRVEVTGFRSWKVVYPFHGRPRWYHIGAVDSIGLSDARKLASRVMFKVAEGKDPAAERKAERSKGSFEDLYQRYLQYAKRKNKSWMRTDKLVRKHVLSRWGKLSATTITRADVKSVLAKLADTPSQANLVLANTSAVFSWAVKEELLKSNPCSKIDGHKTESRERVLSDGELPKFWIAFDNAGLNRSMALKMLLLTGQRPGEVEHMRREHIKDNWWEMPGQPVPELKWPGTKNKRNHRVWLPKAAKALLAELDEDNPASGPVFSNVGRLSETMSEICDQLGVTDKVRPHDLRRTHGTMITGLGFGRDAMPCSLSAVSQAR